MCIPFETQATAQVVGDDLHLTAFVGAEQMMDEAPEHGLDVAWVEDAEKPKRSHSVGEPAIWFSDSSRAASVSCGCRCHSPFTSAW